MLSKLWMRHLFFRTAKHLALFMLSFFCIYVLIDYSIYANQLAKQGSVGIYDIFLYYVCLFTKRLHLILLLGFSLSIITALIQMNERREIVALLCAGLTKKALLKPLWLIATALFVLMMMNFQFAIPKALAFLDNFEQSHLKKSKKIGFKKIATYALFTKQGHRLLFSKMDLITHIMEDVYLIISSDELWKIQKLDTFRGMAIGYQAEHLKRNHKNELTLLETVAIKKFEPFDVEFVIKKKGQTSYEDLSILELSKMLSDANPSFKKERFKILTQLTYKIMIPFLSFLVIIACAPFCLVFSRKLPIFMIYAMSIFGMIAFFTLMDGAIIIGESQVIKGQWVIIAPFLLSLLIFGPKFIKCCNN